MDNKEQQQAIENVIGGDAAKQLLGEDLLCDIDPQRKMKRLQSDMSVESCASSASTQSGDELEGLHQASRNYDDMLGHLIYGGILNKYCTPASTPRTEVSNLNTPRFSIPSTTPRQLGEWTKHFCDQHDQNDSQNIDWQNVTPRESIDSLYNGANIPASLPPTTNLLADDVNLSHALSHALSDGVSVQDIETLLSTDVNGVNMSYALQHVLSDALSVQNSDNALSSNQANIDALSNNMNIDALTNDIDINALSNMLSDMNVSQTLSEPVVTPQLLPQLDTLNAQNAIQSVKSDVVVPDVFQWYEENIEDALLTQLEKLLCKMGGRNAGGKIPQQKKGADMGHYSSKIAESFFSMERGTNGSPTSSLDFRGAADKKASSQAAGLGLNQKATENKSALDSLYASVGNKSLKDLSAEQPKSPQLRANAPSFNPNAASFTPQQIQPQPQPQAPAQTPPPPPTKPASTPTADQLDLPDFIKNAVHKPVQQPAHFNNIGMQKEPRSKPHNWSTPTAYSYNSFTGQNTTGNSFSADVGYTGSRYIHNVKNVQSGRGGRGPRVAQPPAFLFDSDVPQAFGYGVDINNNNQGTSRF